MAREKAALAIRSDADARVLLDQQKAILAKVETLPDATRAWIAAKTFAAMVAAARGAYGVSKEVSDDSVAHRLDVERRLAQLVAEGQKRGEIAMKGGDRKSKPPSMALKDATGIDAENFAPIAELGRLTDKTYLAAVATAREAGDLSRAAVLWASDTARRGALYTQKHDDWQTPRDLFALLDEEFHFDLDVCATDPTALCPRYFTPETDGLAQSWKGRCWMNPPYGPVIGDWMRKATTEVAERHAELVVCLVPARTDTAWWWDYARHGEVRFIRGRLHFSDGGTAPFPSAIVVLGRRPRVVWWTAWPPADAADEEE